MGKIDIHLHLGLESIEHHTKGIAGSNPSYSEGNTPQPSVMKMSSSVDMLPHLRELGISGGIILSLGEGNAPFYKNDLARRAADAVPGVYAWMCNLDAKDIDTVETRLASYKEQGAVGIGEFAINQWIGSPFIEAVFTAAEKLGLPILFHMSPEEGFNYGLADKPGLPLLEDAMKRHPKLILVGHSQPFWHEISGGVKEDNISRNSWGTGPVLPGGRLPQLLDRYPSLYCDLSANSGGNAIMRDEPYGLAFLEKYQDRLMFGTDMGNTEITFPLGGWLDARLADGSLSGEVYDKICTKNAERIFGLKLIPSSRWSPSPE